VLALDADAAPAALVAALVAALMDATDAAKEGSRARLTRS
jgi:hypothetical protein